MKLTWNDCLKIGVSIFGLYLCINLWPGAVALVKALLGASAPLILGCAIAYVVNILMRFFETHWPTTGKFSAAALKFRRPVSLLLAFASVAALVVLIFALIVPQLISCVQLLLSEIPGAMTKAVAFVNSLNIVPQDLLAPLLKVDWQSKLLDILKTLTSGVGNVMGAVITTVSSMFSALVTGLLALIFSIYLLLAFASVAALVVLIFALIVPQLISCVQLLLSEIPGAMTKAVAFVNSLNIVPQDLLAPLLKVDWQSKLLDILKTLTSGVGNVMGAVISTVSSFFSALVTGLLALIFSIYLLLSQEDLKRQFGKLLRRFLPSKWLGRFSYGIHTLDDCFHRYIVGQCLEAVIIGALCALGMGLLRLPYATMIGALVGFTALIPVAGAYIGAGVGAFMILTVDPIQALIFLVFLVILQQLEGNLIYPKVVGSSLGLPGIWVLAAVTVGGGLLGIGGMLLGVPLAAAIYRMLGEEVNSHLSEA